MYAELHAHSAYSFLDGASLPEELVIAALRLGYRAFALTDHNSVSGSMEFAQTAKSLGLRALHGAEFDLDDGHHLTLLVRDSTGWANLCRLLTRAHADTRTGGGPLTTPIISVPEVLDHTAGLVCLSGCYARGIHDEPTLRRLRDGFGPENLRVELQRPYLPGDRARNRRLAWLAQRLELRTVATGNVHAHARARAPLQDAFVALRLHSTLDASEPDRRGNFSHVLATPAAMEARFPEYPEAIAETARLAESLQFDLTSDLSYSYPGAEDPRKLRELAGLCNARFHERYDDQPAAVREAAAGRLEQELRLIEKLNLAGFFVLHHEMLELAREVAVEVRGRGADGVSSPRAKLPPGRGRGSSVSSVICYLTGLSHVDPIANELAIGRFLSEDLKALPDIDLDFPRDIREVLIPRVSERFGSDRAALVAAFPTYRARGAIRELGKVLGLPPGEIERVARGSEGWDARGVGRDIETASGGAPLVGRWAWLARLARQAHGLPRHLSQHPGGMIIATRPLIDCCPVVPAAMEGRYIAQWDKDSCADAGFLKIDLLGLGMLSAVERCVELIAHTRGEQIDLSRIPHQDPETYDAIQHAETTGVFQIESRAQMQSLLRTRPENLRDVAIQVAIVRPGPIQGGAVNPYIERRQRLRVDPNYQIPYEHPSLEPALRETLGAIIFQDQVLEVASAFAGFRPGEAEDLRRAMSRKRSEAAIEAHHERFVQGAVRLHGVEPELAERVFEKVKGFSGFGFPKSHAAAFGLLAYQSTWLRVHYGPEFLCALLNEQPMGFYPPDSLVHEAQRRGLDVIAPDVNASGVECTIDAEGRVVVGLGYIRGVRRSEIEALVAERERSGPFKSLSDLASRAGTGAPALDLLAWSGACDALAVPMEIPASLDPAALDPATLDPATPGPFDPKQNDNDSDSHYRFLSGSRARAFPVSARRLALWQLGTATAAQGVRGAGTQLALPLELPRAPALPELSGWEELVADYSTTGMTVTSHPMALLRSRLPKGSSDSRDLAQLRHGTKLMIGGLVVARQRPGTASGVVFVLLEDEFGVINLIVPPPIYERHRLIVRTEPLLLIEGKLERYAKGGGAINVLVSRVEQVMAPGGLVAKVQDFSPLDDQALAAQRDTTGSADDVDDFRAVAPPVMSFAAGRRR
ncbi:MAG TPA: DNA polymerase III subunit alpha [Solirubrobacteraceae bacterium]|nr:DNA polymerase III subunit alpha [Solirubrobacteraceae bacterium]